MEPITRPDLIRTRFLIISDTHGKEFPSDDKLLKHADVAMHCGDLTESSLLEEYRASIRLLKDIDAPLKLVIAGNHDFTMDLDIYEAEVANARQSLGPDAVKEGFGNYGEARQLFEEAKDAGIVFLDEGNHQFALENGALLIIYASPYTPYAGGRGSASGGWGFQYSQKEGHSFTIAEGTDLVITHGPPEGILDRTNDSNRAGSSHLFAAVARARPRLHCFGHIHPGWRARMVTWRDQLTETPSHWTDIDNERSFVVEKLSGLRESKSDAPEVKEEKLKKTELCRQERCCTTSHCDGDADPLEYGKQTLFVNAATQGTEENPFQLPWLVDLELPRAG